MSTITGDSPDALESSATDVNRATPELPPRNLPDEPLTTIQPSKSWAPINFREIWQHRGLLYFLTWRDLKVRYKQTALGMAWVVLQPLLTTAVFTVFLGYLVRVQSDGIPYPLFAFAGLLPWTFFMGAINSSSNSLVGNAHLITKVYFPRAIVPIAAVTARLPDFGIALLVLFGLAIYYGVSLSWNILMMPVCVGLLTLLALGVGMTTSALNVKYRDVGVMIPLLLQIWMFASPIVYPVSLVPAGFRKWYSLNPLVGIIDGFRTSLLGGQFDWYALSISACITFAILLLAIFSFRRMERYFADIV